MMLLNKLHKLMMAFTIKQKPLTVPPLNSVVEGVKCLFTAILHTY